MRTTLIPVYLLAILPWALPGQTAPQIPAMASRCINIAIHGQFTPETMSPQSVPELRTLFSVGRHREIAHACPRSTAGNNCCVASARFRRPIAGRSRLGLPGAGVMSVFP
jgi:hypothetical protein